MFGTSNLIFRLGFQLMPCCSLIGFKRVWGFLRNTLIPCNGNGNLCFCHLFWHGINGCIGSKNIIIRYNCTVSIRCSPFFSFKAFFIFNEAFRLSFCISPCCIFIKLKRANGCFKLNIFVPRNRYRYLRYRNLFRYGKHHWIFHKAVSIG